MFEPLFTAEGLVSLLTLTLMEVVLGIDNVIFISILSGRLPSQNQGKARTIGLGLALIIRIILLSVIAWIVGLHRPLVSNVFGTGFDLGIRDIILFLGGLFLIYKSVLEIYEKVDGDEANSSEKSKLGLVSAIFQIVLLDIVFSFDSILTAVGLVEDPERDLVIMIVAVVISLVIMLLFSKPISYFVNKHPTIKMLALAFLLMIGVLLVAEAFHKNIPKAYIYFAMAFSLFVEILNMQARKRTNSSADKTLEPKKAKGEEIKL